jgi:hypothetical protein
MAKPEFPRNRQSRHRVIKSVFTGFFPYYTIESIRSVSLHGRLRSSSLNMRPHESTERHGKIITRGFREVAALRLASFPLKKVVPRTTGLPKSTASGRHVASSCFERHAGTLLIAVEYDANLHMVDCSGLFHGPQRSQYDYKSALHVGDAGPDNHFAVLDGERRRISKCARLSTTVQA